MKNFRKTLRTILLATLIPIVAIGCLVGGYVYGNKSFASQIKKNPPKIEVLNKAQPDVKGSNTEDFVLFWQVWDMVTQTYLLRPVDPQKMMDGAITSVQAYFATTDPNATTAPTLQSISTESSQSTTSVTPSPTIPAIESK